MGFPHPTIDIPGSWPEIESELRGLRFHDDYSTELLRGLQGDRSIITGHVCATTWIFSPDGDYTLLVKHKALNWSTPGGHVERHETTRIGGLRELEEETGLTKFDVRTVIDGPAFVHITDRDGEQPHRHWNIGWLYVADMDAPLSKTEGARWFSCSDLPVGPSDLHSSIALLRPLVAR
jgi:ADP-ribose pyrophosphatase YjhB (NUDIX family)